MNTNKMKTNIIAFSVLSLAILNTIKEFQANQNEPISETQGIEQFLNKALQWKLTHRDKFHETQMEISAPIVFSAIFCFIASSISSAGGIGGGGLFIPILTIVAGFDLKTASSLSAFMVTGGSIANVLFNIFSTNSKFGGRNLIDFDIALLSEPCMLLGVSVGVICNLIFPEWLITVLFAVFLAWSTLKTCGNGMIFWKFESEEIRRSGFVKNEVSDTIEGLEIFQEPLLGVERSCKLRFPWKKLGVLVLVWFSFYCLYLIRGNRYGESIIPIEPCGVGYWILSALQVPLAIAFTLWILHHKDQSSQHEPANQEDIKDLTKGGQSNKLVFPLMALLAGILGGMFGIGGGMLISPLLLQVGIAPEITAATCSFMVFFSSTMSACQYLLLGMDHTDIAFVFASVCFIASLVGLVLVQRAIHEYGRVSLIVFSVSIVMALSTVLMTSFGAIDVWRDYVSGKSMGFKLPC